MIQSIFRAPLLSSAARFRRAALSGVLALAFGLCAFAQQPAPASPAPLPAQPDTAQQPPAPGPPLAQAAPPAPQQAAPESQTPVPALSLPASSTVTDEQLEQLLVGKDLFLRGGYLGDAIAYNEHGRLNGHAPYGSYTLCAVRIDMVRLTRHKVELEGIRYGLHFLGALPSEDPTNAVDRVRITPKKKVLKITIDREIGVKAEKVEEPKAAKGPAPAPATAVLDQALNNVFATGIDQRMVAAMPRFWQLYYQAAADKSDFRPADPAVLRQNTVDRKAKLLSTFVPESNQYAQDAGVVGIALYHVVVQPDGKPGEIAVARPIGFGLDENAVSAIQKAKFEPALKDGKPVPVLLDLVVQFRIYSKRTAVTDSPEPADKTDTPSLPGPYSIPHP